MFRPIAYGLAFLLCAIGSPSAEDAKVTYPGMAPLAQYQMASMADETALARSAWGANLRGSPIIAAQSDPEPITTFLIPVTKWSDGAPDVMEK